MCPRRDHRLWSLRLTTVRRCGCVGPRDLVTTTTHRCAARWGYTGKGNVPAAGATADILHDAAGDQGQQRRNHNPEHPPMPISVQPTLGRKGSTDKGGLPILPAARGSVFLLEDEKGIFLQ